MERCDLNIKSNSSSHHTELYGEKRLIVRRGQPFHVILHLKPGSRDFKQGETTFTLIVETGKLPVSHVSGVHVPSVYVREKEIFGGGFVCVHA